ncbi:MAG TPA: cation-transporting P-type ATPase [Polyangiaceae bacterium]|nr:cation-transporting P-type ATPase [Polyangiaceae bacterium]
MSAPGALAERRAADRAPAPHTEPVEGLLARLASDPAHGLTESEAAGRLAREGPNELTKPEGKSVLSRLAAQFANPIVLTLLAAAAIAIVDGASRSGEPFAVRYGDATAILLIVTLNAVLGFFQEQRAEAALAALERMQTPNARVRRDDHVRVVAAREVVAGDVLELESGDAVAADARLLQTINLLVEESTLTGESVPVGKDARAAVADDAPLGDRTTMLFVGTSVVRGKGRAVVVATGPRTELGRLSELIHRPRDRKTPLEEKLESFGSRILWGCLALSALLFARGMLKGDRSWHELLLEAVSLAVAAIPEGLPAITTITLALGMQRMAARGAIVRKLAAVETLGAATVICTDKTGTLTQNEMTVREVYAGGALYRVTGNGYDPSGAILDGAGTPLAAPSPPLRDLLATIALCNNATLQMRDGAWRVVGDPTEGALLTLAAKGGLSREAVVSSHQVLKELPFDSDRKRMTIIALDEAGREVVHSKGSADVLLPRCHAYETNSGRRPLDDAARATVLRESERMSGDAMRVLAVARRELGGKEVASVEAHLGGAGRHGVDIEDRLTFVGLVGMIDPPREGVREAIRLCAEAQVRAVMITGDHKLTAVAIAKELGLWEETPEGAEPTALTGAELDRLSDADLDARVDDVRVFARVTAEQKLRIVAALKRRGHVVAMTGDGVNDAPALREAHIGVAMGKDGTDVAREAADMVIADDNFATIVEAVREGRAIWRNIQKFIFFLLSSNAGLLVAVFAASFASALRPLTPLMILWINLVTNGLPALALGIDPPDPTQMREPPRKRTAGLLGTRDWLGIAFVGVCMGAAAMVCYVVPMAGPHPLSVKQARAIAFSLLALSPLMHAFNCRSTSASILSLRPLAPTTLIAAVVASAAIHLVAVLVPSLRPVFQTFSMDGSEWAMLIALSVSIVPAVELAKFAERTARSRAAKA